MTVPQHVPTAAPVASAGAAAGPVVAAPAARSRLEWVDAGRGVAILLVVLYHATQWLVGVGVRVEYWVEINDVLATMRMPLFFALSGLFAGKWLRASWSALWNTKLRLFVWVFLLWEVIGAVVTYGSLALQGREFGLLHEGLKVVLSPLAPQLELWFLWALALFFVIARAARNVDSRLQLAVAAVLSVVALSVDLATLPWDVNIGWAGAAKYLLFFLGGIHLRSAILAFSQRPARVLLPVFLVWAAVAAGLALLDLRFVPGLYWVNCLLGVVGGVALSQGLARAQVLRRIGANTLPIYLAHTPLIVILTTLVALTGAAGALNAVDPVVPLVLMVVAVVLSLLLHRVAMRRRTRQLYEPPPALLVRPE